MGSKNYKAGETWRGGFVTDDSDGVTTAADSLPTGTLGRNGADDGAVAVTVAQVAGGRYTFSLAIPTTYVPGDELDVWVTATVGGLTTTRVVESSRLVSPGFDVLLPATYGEQAVADAVRHILSDRVDFLTIGDSESLHSDGTDSGLTDGLSYALAQYAPQFATPLYSWRENNGNGTGQGYLMTTGSGSGASSGAPSQLAAYLAKGSGALFPDDYLFGDMGSTDTGGLILYPGNPLDATGPLLWELHVGTFPSGTHTIQPNIQLQNPFAYDPYVPEAGLVNLATGAYAMTRREYNVPADPARAGREVDFRPYVFGGASITGVFGLYQRLSRTDRPAGWSVTALDARGGSPTRIIATDLQQASDLTLTYKFSQIRRLQGATKRVVVVIYLGQDDESDTVASVGPSPQTSNTAGGWKDNLTAIALRMRYIWALNGWDQSELYFAVVASHPLEATGGTRENWLDTLRAAARDWCKQQPQARTVDLSRYTSYADLLARGYYYNDGGTAHLTTAGYRYIAGFILQGLAEPAQQAVADAVLGSPGDAGDVLAAIQAQTDKIANGVNVVGGFVKGNLTIRQGDSYTPTSGQRLKIPKPAGAPWPADLTGWTVTLTGKAKADVTGTGSKSFQTVLTVVDPAGVQDLYPDALTAATTGGLAPSINGWEYTIRAVLNADANQANTLLSGVLSVAPQLTP